jgi:hypothetical protein
MLEDNLDPSAYRSFGAVDDEVSGAPMLPTLHKPHQTVEHIRGDIIGAYHKFEGPFGAKPCIYADWTASGRALKQIEGFISEEVLPFYGNTHTVTSITGNQVRVRSNSSY